ncbi:MAG TPA: leucine-rich repeat domain-containing protein, partial [Verrucomicrobiae bacterium]|nr:leucine-rich repeat domain-containing protein [Verrucomicrobiae bacterium]
IPNSVTNIGSGAFQACASLTAVYIPAGVTSVGNAAFIDCPSLTAITVDALNSCYSSVDGVLFDKNQTMLIAYPGGQAGSYTIPNGVTSIGYETFWNSTGLTSITIPNSVTSIGARAFDGCSSLTSITIPDSVTSIGEEAFEYCSSLASVMIGSSVTSIGNYAFCACPSLTGLTVPNGVTSIGQEALEGCSNLISVTIPNSVTNLGSYEFIDCSGLVGVYFNGDAPSPDSSVFTRDNQATVYYLKGTKGWGPTFDGLPAVLWDPQVLAQLIYTTNNGTITISAYIGTGGAVVIPGTINGLLITGIGSNVLYNCTNLTSVTIPDSVTNLGDSALAGCTALTNITIPNSVTSIGNSAFAGCTALTSITIPNSVTSIGNSEFSGCPALTSITIPGSVTNIGSWAFNDCYNLTAVYFQGNAPVADSTVFNGDLNVTNYYLPRTAGWGASFAGSPTVPVLFTYTNNSGAITITAYIGIWGSVVIPGTINNLPVTGIGNSAFYECPSLTNITMGSNVTSVAGQAFVGCPNLQAILVDALNPFYSSVDGVLFNKSQTMLIACPEGNAGSYTIPNSITRIGGEAFFDCASLTNVTIPNSVTSIGNYAFFGCIGLANITIPNGVIGDHAFDSCTNLTSVTIGNGVTSIGDYAFDGCAGLTSVTIPASVSGIGDEAFAGCSTLTGVYFQGNAPGLGSRVFYQVNNATVYYMPGTTGWSAQVQTSGASFGVQTNVFGFTITGNSSLGIVVQACTNLANPVWSPVGTNILTGGSSYFSDPQWTNYTCRFYRLGVQTFARSQAVLWNPQVQTGSSSFGMQTNQFGFTITGTSNLVIVVEACTNLANPVWSRVGTNTLTGGSSYFSDLAWTNYQSRFYRLTAP